MKRVKRTVTKSRAAAPKKRAKATTGDVAASLERVTHPAVEEVVRARAAYNSVVASAQLAAIRLVRSSFVVTPEYLMAEPSPTAAHSLSFGGRLAHSDVNAQAGHVLALFEWWVEAKPKDGDEVRLRIDCAYLVEYAGLDMQVLGVDDAARAFVRRVGRFAVFPYVRALVSRLSAEAGADLPLLPLLKEGTAGTDADRERRPQTDDLSTGMKS